MAVIRPKTLSWDKDGTTYRLRGITEAEEAKIGNALTQHQDISGKVDKVTGKGLSTNDYTTEEKNKLAGIAAGATANVGTITGITMNGSSKGTSGVVNLGTVITAHQDISGKLNTSLKGAANGLAELDANGKVPSSQLPSYVDDVLEYAGLNLFPATGESDKIYIDTATNITYRWGGTEYVPIGSDLAIGETSSTAYRGDRGKIAYDHASAKGSAFSSGLYKITTNAQGHVTAATAVQKSDITGLGIPGSDTTYSAATQSAAGLMSSTDKTKLDGIASGATANAGTVTKVSTGAGLTGGDVTSTGTIKANLTSETKLTNAAADGTETSGRVYPVRLDKNGKLAVNVPWTDANTQYSAATQSAAGLMSASDKTKLDGIATGAEVNQNAFSNVAVGSTTIAADGKTDTLTLAAGSNITLTPDATNDKVTIAATDTTYAFDGTYNASSNKAATVSTVTNAIGALDGNLNSTTPGSGKTLTAFSQTDGKVSATFGNISITKSQVSDFPSSMTPSSHTHGNIQNGGTLQTNDVTIASGDKLVVTDSSNSNKVARTSVSFDGSTTSKALTPKGTFETFLQSHQSLSGYVPTSRKVNGKALSSNITLSSSDVSAAPSSTVSCTTANVKSALGTGTNDNTFLRKDGNWATPVDMRPIVVELGALTNTSGSYTNTFTSANVASIANVVAGMKPIVIECSDPSAFKTAPTITTGANSITVQCDNFAGSSTLTVTLAQAVDATGATTYQLTSAEATTLQSQVGNPTSLTTTNKSNLVSAVNELNYQIETHAIATGITNLTAYKAGNLVMLNFFSTNSPISVPAGGYKKVGTLPNTLLPINGLSIGVTVDTSTRVTGSCFLQNRDLYFQASVEMNVTMATLFFMV